MSPKANPHAVQRPAASVDASDWRYPPKRAREVLAQQICPICGRGAWQSPLNHVARKHGIDRRTMRDICDLTLREKVTDPELSERFAERSAQTDMAKVRPADGPRTKQQWTRRGRAKNTATIVATNQDPNAPRWREQGLAKAHRPESRAKQGSSMRLRWAALDPDERRRKAAHLKRTSEELSEQSLATWDKRGRKPCGTRAAYRRGCRCAPCRSAYLAYKRAHG